jgi:hypothetical protein
MANSPTTDAESYGELPRCWRQNMANSPAIDAKFMANSPAAEAKYGPTQLISLWKKLEFYMKNNM